MQPTTIASWATVIWRALEARAIPPRPIFERAGVDAGLLSDAGARIPVAAMTRLWDGAVETGADPCFGLRAGQHVHPTTFHALGYAWFASRTLHEALDRFVRFTRLVSTALRLSTETVGSEVALHLETIQPTTLHSSAATDAGMVALVTMCRTSAGDDFRPLRVRLRRPQLACEPDFAAFFRAPITYDTNENVVVFALADLDRALPTANADLARSADEVIHHYLARFDRDDVVSKARTKLMELLPSGETNARRVAEALHLSVRSLQRKLAAHGTSLAQLIEQTRRELADQYVRNSRLSVGEITYLLGFAEPASFTRAFRRWNGMSPSASRQAANSAPARSDT